MRPLLTATMIFAAVAVLASERELSLGDYVGLARTRIEKKLSEALSGQDFPDTVSGTVSLSSRNFFFLQGKQDALKVVMESGECVPSGGDVVKAIGKPSLEGGRVVFVAEKWTKTGESSLPEAKSVSADDLVFSASSEEERSRDINWRRVTVKGRAIGETENGFAMEIDSVPVTVDIKTMPDFMDRCGEMRPLVSVTGIAELILDQSVLFGRQRYVLGVKIIADSVNDVKLLPDFTYLMNRRDRRIRLAAAVVFSLLVALLLILAVFAVRQERRNLSARMVMQERKRMADDLHDTIEQHLVGAGMLLQLSKVKQAREILLRAKSEMRDIVWGLKNDDMLRTTPAQMIKELAKEETKKGICRVVARVFGLPEKMELGAVRDLSLIIREAIGNAIKHGQAKKIAITCDPGPNGGWLLRIANDGELFDEKTAPGPSEGHFGIEGMRARARRIGAELSFSVKGVHTVLVLEKKQ